MKNDELIKVENISKKFSRDLKKSLWYGIKDIGSDLIGSSNNNIKLRKKEFWALQNISFELKRGEVLGLIGRNGAGKTTLLKLLNGLAKPDSGKITMRGRVGALIALGAGFNPILTGRENVYVNGSVLGLSKKEIDNKFDEIVDFAELWDFIDTPVQSYSSGMQVRLGFSIATAMNPDILLLDEVLAVGDLKFRLKCYRKIDEIKEKAAMIFVSHSLEQISRICSRVMVLGKGAILHYGDVADGLKIYNSISYTHKYETTLEYFYPIRSFELKVDIKKVNYGDPLVIYFRFDSSETFEAKFRLLFFEYPSRIVAGEVHSEGLGIPRLQIQKGSNTFTIKIPNLNLKAGKYALGHNLNSLNGEIISTSEGMIIISVNGTGFGETHNQVYAHLV